MTLPPGHAIVDPGAARDLIGEPSFRRLVDKLKAIGLQPVVLDSKPDSASGIGGQATPLFEALVPCFLGKQPGIIKLIVLQEDVPQLLSIGLLEHAKAVIDTADNTIYFKAFNCEATMERLSSGHRVLDVAAWDGGKFEVPRQVLERFDLAPDAFELSDSTSDRAYIGSCGRGFSDGEFFGENLQLRDSLETLLKYSEPKGRVFYQKGLGQVFIGKNTCLGKPEGLDRKFCWRSTFAVFRDRFVKLEHVVFVPNLPHTVFVSEDNITYISLYTDIHDLTCLYSFPNILHRDISKSIHGSPMSHVACSEAVKSQHVGREEVASATSHHDIEVIRNCEDTAVRVSPDPTAAVCSNLSGLISLEPTSLHHEAFSKRDGDRSAAGALVQFGEEAASSTSEGIQFSNATRAKGNSYECSRHSDDRCAGALGSEPSQMHTSRGVSSPGCQSVWPLGEMQSVQDEAQVRGLQQFEPSKQVIQSDIIIGGTCASAKDGSSSEELSRRRSDECRFATGVGEAESSLGGGDHSGFDTSGTGSGSSQSIDAPHDVQLGCGKQSDASDANSSAVQHSGRGFGDDQSQHRGLGVATVRGATSDVSLAAENSWFTAPLSPGTLGFKSALRSDKVYLSHGSDGQIRIVWKDDQLGADLVCSDFVDDKEFQIPKRIKKQLSFAVHALLDKIQSGKDARTSRAIEEGQEHGEDVRTSRPLGSGEDVRTSRATIEGQEHGEDVRTSRLESSGEDVRTSRSQGGQVCTRLEEGSLAHLSPVRLSALSSLTRGSGCHGKLKICELFSVPRLTARLNEFGLTATFPAAFDQEVGWQFFDAADRARFWHTLRTQKPDFVMMSPYCKPFSILMNVNWSKMDPEQVKQMQVEGLTMLHFCVQVAEFQMSQGKFFGLEHPGSASSWSTHAMAWLLKQDGVIRFLFDQCALGLQVSEEGLSRKTTGLVTNHLGVAAVLSQYQCSKDHPHVPLEHGLPHKARIYPDDMVKAILTGLTFQDQQSSFAAGFDEEEENDLRGPDRCS